MAGWTLFYPGLLCLMIGFGDSLPTDAKSESNCATKHGDGSSNSYDSLKDDLGYPHRVIVTCFTSDPTPSDHIVESNSKSDGTVNSVESINCAVLPANFSFGTAVPDLKEVIHLKFNTTEAFTKEHSDSFNELYILFIKTNATQSLLNKSLHQMRWGWGNLISHIPNIKIPNFPKFPELPEFSHIRDIPNIPDFPDIPE